MNMNDEIKSVFKIVKDYIVLITIIPYLIGGAMQVFQLSYISINLLRFFSLSQMVSDGLQMMIFFIIPLISILPVIGLKVSFKLYSTETKLLKALRIAFYILGILVCFINLYKNIKLESITELIKFLFYDYLLLGIIYWIYMVKFNAVHSSLKLGVFLYSINLIVSFFAFSNIDNNQYQIENFKVLKENISLQNNNYKHIEILYFNDKYIFIEADKGKSKITLIKKIDDLFEENK
jgi:hypothetical protein